MIGTIERKFKPIVLVSREKLCECVELVDTVIKKCIAENKTLEKVIDKSPRITVTYSNGDKYKCENVDEVFQLQDLSTNPVRSILISGGAVTLYYMEIALGGRWTHSSDGAVIEITSDKNSNLALEQEISRIFSQEKHIYDLIPSLNAVISGFFVFVFLGYLLGLFEQIYIDIFNRKELLFGYLWISVVSTGVLAWMISALKKKFFGNAAFLWGNGLVRYEKYRAYANHALWTVPASILFKLAF